MTPAKIHKRIAELLGIDSRAPRAELMAAALADLERLFDMENNAAAHTEIGGQVCEAFAGIAPDEIEDEIDRKLHRAGVREPTPWLGVVALLDTIEDAAQRKLGGLS